MRSVLSAAVVLVVSANAQAFCGFFVSGADAKLTNTASQVVLMRRDNRTVMTMSNTYKGPPENFAMVVPVPVVLRKEDVRTLPPSVFDKIDALSAPRLVEYWEQDPCYVPPVYEAYPMSASAEREPRSVKRARRTDDDFGVKVEARFTVGEYEIVILSAKEATGLEGWLNYNKYKIPAGASEALAPYVRSQTKFFVAKVDITKVRRDAQNVVLLSPLRFSFESQELRLPVRLGLLNAESKQDLIVYVLHPTSRFEAANYTNAFIPSNLEVEDGVRQQFGAFYATLFDETMRRAQGRAVITEYSWQTTSCDPCPVAPLNEADMLTLGFDLLGAGEERNRYTPSWVLTRMHTRYDKQTLSEDLVFVPGNAVSGGRGSYGADVEQAGAVVPAQANNFQGRYIIRHYWQGEAKCQSPRWGVWGGPPNGGQSTQAARDLANAPRDAVALTKVVRTKLPQLNLPGKPPPKH